MITVKAFNIIHQGRKNQNTTWFFSDVKHFGSGEITEDFLLENFDLIKPKDVERQNNTKLKIISKSK